MELTHNYCGEGVVLSGIIEGVSGVGGAQWLLDCNIGDYGGSVVISAMVIMASTVIYRIWVFGIAAYNAMLMEVLYGNRFVVVVVVVVVVVIWGLDMVVVICYSGGTCL